MAHSTKTKTYRHFSVVFSDSADGNTFTLPKLNGSISYSVPGPGVDVALTKGQFTDPPDLFHTTDAPITGTITANFADVSDDDYETISEFFENSGKVASDWVSTALGANAEVSTTKITLNIEGDDYGDTADHSIAFAYCHFNGALAVGAPSTVTINFTDYELYPTVT